jgi:hypothetical protein
MEVSEKDIETLREAIDGCGGPSYTQALAILDRLSPAPEPEVDEATWKQAREIWEVAFKAWEKRRYDGTGNGAVEAVAIIRQAIAELIASKDGEIEGWKATAQTASDNVFLATDRVFAAEAETTRVTKVAEKAESELATLRAENMRLKGCLRRIAGLEFTYDGSDLESAKLIAEQATEPNTRCTYCGRYRWEADEKGSTHCNAPFDLQPHDFKAAERNTAEPESHLFSASNSTYSEWLKCNPAYGKAHTDTSRSGGMPPGTNAGAVRVTKAAATSAQIYADFHCEDGSFNVTFAERLAAEFDKVRTEAEARGYTEGRRDALEKALEVVVNSSQPRFELERMMTGEK